MGEVFASPLPPIDTLFFGWSLCGWPLLLQTWEEQGRLKCGETRRENAEDTRYQGPYLIKPRRLPHQDSPLSQGSSPSIKTSPPPSRLLSFHRGSSVETPRPLSSRKAGMVLRLQYHYLFTYFYSNLNFEYLFFSFSFSFFFFGLL